MSKFLFEGKYQNVSTMVKVKLLLFHFQDENKVNFIYSPHLDLTGYGRNIEEAKESFKIVFEDFIEYTIKKNTINKVLSGLGWKLDECAKKTDKIIAPSIISVIKDNKYISDIFDKYSVNTYHQEVVLPISA